METEDLARALAETYCSYPPSTEEWFSRRDEFMRLGNKLYNGEIKRELPEKFKAFERELERCYCSGAYIGCLVLAASISEIFMLSLIKDERVKLKGQLVYIEEGLDWLRGRRNDLLHTGRPSNHLSRSDYTEGRGDLESDARRASSIIYHIAREFVRL